MVAMPKPEPILPKIDPQKLLDEARLALARKSFRAFCEYLWEPLQKHQEVWADILMRPGNDVIVAPPGTWKTTLCQRLVAYLMGREPEQATLWLMNADEQAARNIMAVQQIVTSKGYQAVFPDMKPDRARGWSKQDLFQKFGPKAPRGSAEKADPSLAGRGLTGDFQGMHPTHLIIDDPTKPQDLQSPATMSQQRHLVRGVIYDRLKKRVGCIAHGIKVICTRWGQDDLVKTFKEMGFTIHAFPIIGEYPWGRLLFELEYPDDEIEKIRLAKRTVGFEEEFYAVGDVFEMTYMCNPQQTEGILVKRSWWMKYNEAPDPEKLIRHVVAWDYSTGVARDYTAWLYGAMSMNAIYFLGAGWGKWSEHEVHQNMIKVDTAIRPENHAVEWAGISIPIIMAFKRKYPNIPLDEHKPGSQSKGVRLHAQAHYIQAGTVYIPGTRLGIWWSQEVIDQCAKLQLIGDSPGNDDFADCVSTLLNYFSKTGGLPRHMDTGSGGATGAFRSLSRASALVRAGDVGSEIERMLDRPGWKDI